ncbi:MAG: hypothetical protein JW731_07730 [Bacteroidales bacterium]|nr:hypothetical protein [Bacteroidales bacterium]
MNKLFLLIISVIIAVSCAKIPLESLTLADSLTNEGSRMHQLNIALINKMFAEKRQKIDEFITMEYTPQYIKNFTQAIPPDADIKEELPEILNSIIPEINSRRDMMQSALEDQRIKLVTKLGQDYAVYLSGSNELRKLLESNVQVDKERKEFFDSVKGMTNDKIDLNKVEDALDGFITDSGDVSASILDLNETINSIINQ